MLRSFELTQHSALYIPLTFMTIPLSKASLCAMQHAGQAVSQMCLEIQALCLALQNSCRLLLLRPRYQEIGGSLVLLICRVLAIPLVV